MILNLTRNKMERKVKKQIGEKSESGAGLGWAGLHHSVYKSLIVEKQLHLNIITDLSKWYTCLMLLIPYARTNQLISNLRFDFDKRAQDVVNLDRSPLIFPSISQTHLYQFQENPF